MFQNVLMQFLLTEFFLTYTLFQNKTFCLDMQTVDVFIFKTWGRETGEGEYKKRESVTLSSSPINDDSDSNTTPHKPHNVRAYAHSQASHIQTNTCTYF